MQELGNAINDSLSDPTGSRRRSAKSSGPGTTSSWFWKPRSASTGGTRTREDEDEEQLEVTEEPKRTFEATGKIKFTSQDHRFLRALKIAVDDENR